MADHLAAERTEPEQTPDDGSQRDWVGIAMMTTLIAVIVIAVVASGLSTHRPGPPPPVTQLGRDSDQNAAAYAAYATTTHQGVTQAVRWGLVSFTSATSAAQVDTFLREHPVQVTALLVRVRAGGRDYISPADISSVNPGSPGLDTLRAVMSLRSDEAPADGTAAILALGVRAPGTTLVQLASVATVGAVEIAPADAVEVSLTALAPQ